MNEKDKIKNGISLIGNIKNFLDHRKFKKQIESLKYSNFNINQQLSFTRINLTNLNAKISSFYNQFIGLYNYSKINIKKLFRLFNIHNNEIEILKSQIKKLEREINELKREKEK